MRLGANEAVVLEPPRDTPLQFEARNPTPIRQSKHTTHSQVMVNFSVFC